MLRLSKLADYGTVLMVHLAKNEQRVHNAKEIAAHTHLPVPTVSKLLKLLAGAGLLSSLRGVKGGYSLAQSPEHLSVADIIAAIEGDTGLTECSHHAGECSLEMVCSISQNWQVINRALDAALRSVTLAALAQPALSITAVDVSQVRHLQNRNPMVNAMEVPND